MIRPGHTPRPDSCCTSSDVLTPTERAAERMPSDHFADAGRMVLLGGPQTWGDHPEIRAILQSLRATL